MPRYSAEAVRKTAAGVKAAWAAGKYAAHVRPRVTVRCSTCDRELLRKKDKVATSKTGMFFCNTTCQDSGLARERGYLTGPEATGSRVPPYRQRALRHYGRRCMVCGYNGPALEVDHVDGDRENNKIANLQVLCATHHREKELMGQGYILAQIIDPSFNG